VNSKFTIMVIVHKSTTAVRSPFQARSESILSYV